MTFKHYCFCPKCLQRFIFYRVKEGSGLIFVTHNRKTIHVELLSCPLCDEFMYFHIGADKVVRKVRGEFSEGWST